MDKELKREYANIAFYAVILIIYLIVIINKANVTWWVPWAWIAISSIQIFSSYRRISKSFQNSDIKK